MSTSPYTKRIDNSQSPPGEGSAKKRRKGAARLSCAECRRLKLKCDRNIPCGSCQKRGCSAICPDGSLTTGQGNRFVLASTTELHEKISQLANRVRDLEDSLRSSHSQISPDPHPLLTEELLRIKAPLQREPSDARSSPTQSFKEEEQNSDVADAFGSLSISVSGRAKYFGSFANSWYFLQNEYPEDEEDESTRITSLQNILPSEVLGRSAAFPIAPTSQPNLDFDDVQLRGLLWYLPPPHRATELREIYYQHAAWMYNPISPEAFMDEIYAQFYDPSALPPVNDSTLSHRLSLMFMVLAIGSLVDTKVPPYSIDAEKYHQLARAALFQNGLFDEPTINAVQALHLMSFYLFLADRHGRGSGTRWAIMGMAVKVAQSIGLHRDSGRWKVDAAETQRRRELFWELYTYDSWQCLTFGRPPSFSLAHVDCKMPHPATPADDQCFHAWKHRFSSECISLVHDQAFGAKNPTYATVLQLDRKLRGFPVPLVLQVAGMGTISPQHGGPSDSVRFILQRHIVLSIRETNLLYLHRSFFARAVNDHPADPLGSPYGTSVIAAYRSAGSLVAMMRNLHEQLRELTERIWFLWAHIFSCAIVLGSIVTRCPSMSLAPSALSQLDSACELFAKAADGFNAQKVLMIMLQLQKRAHVSLSEYHSGVTPTLAQRISGSPTEPLAPAHENDELATFGGKTRLVAKTESIGTPPLNLSPSTQRPVVPLPLTSTSDPHVHPNVVEYLRTFVPTPGPESMGCPSTQQFVDTSMYTMSPMTGPFTSDTNLFQQPQHHSHSHSPSNPSLSMDPVLFPQYFPVYDYGPPEDTNYANSLPQMDVTMTDSMVSLTHRRNSTPETNMHTTWNDFVSGLGMAN